MKALDVFTYELNQIKNKEIRDWVISIFHDYAPDYFWDCPASLSGKYHPALSLGKGGLVRHTKLAVYWGIELYSALPNDNFSTDEIIAALLLHDLQKNETHVNTMTHGSVFASLITENGRCDTAWANLIMLGIGGHMGVWTQPDPLVPQNMCIGFTRDFCQLVHLADYCASRKVDEEITNLMQDRDASA